MTAEATPQVLAAKKVTKRFGGLVAVNQVDFTIPERSIVSLIGPNGAGKTTFFNIIAGLYDPTAGTIEFRGRPMIARSRRTFLEPIVWIVPAVVVGIVGFLVGSLDDTDVGITVGFIAGAIALIAMMLSAIAAPWAPLPRSPTNDRSIFSVSIGNWRR